MNLKSFRGSLKKRYIKLFFIFITFFISFSILFRFCSEFEIRRTNLEELPLSKINSQQYPWSIIPGVITKVANYREAYDIDSNDWIAQFNLLPEEIQYLSGKLLYLPLSEENYRCNISIINWTIKHKLCNPIYMHSKGFKGYFYNPSFCPAGCKQKIILWVNESSGESYIVGSPDYS